MNRLKYLLTGLLVALPIVVGVAVAHAQSFRSGPNVTVAANQTVDNTLFAAGSTIEVVGTVNGDIFCAGQNVVVSGTVRGDVICAGQTVTVSGDVSGDVRLAGQTVSVGGKVAGNATIGAQNFTLLSGGNVGGDVSLGAATAVFNGMVGRDLAAGTGDGQLDINSVVGRNVQATVDQLTLGSGARIGGNVTYASANKLTQSSSAQVAGNITQTQPPASNDMHVGSWVTVAWVIVLYLFFALLLVALVLVLLVPQLFQTATTYSLAHLGKTFLVGLLASLVVPAVLFVLLLTIIGIPLALLAGLAWMLLSLLAWPVAAYLLGRMLWRNATNAIWIMMLGAVLLLLTFIVPILGMVVAAVAFWFGLGTVLLNLQRRLGRPYYHLEPAVAVADTAAPALSSDPIQPASKRRKP